LPLEDASFFAFTYQSIAFQTVPIIAQQLRAFV